MLVKTGLYEQSGDLVHHCDAVLPGQIFSPPARFQLLLLYHVFPEIRRLVKDNYAYDDHCEQDQGEEDHEEDIGGGEVQTMAAQLESCWSGFSM